MSKASPEQLFQMQSVLFNNAKGISDLSSELVQRIIDRPKVSGLEFMKFLQNCIPLKALNSHVINTNLNPFNDSNLSVKEHRKMGKIIWNLSNFSLHISTKEESYRDFYNEGLEDKSVANASVLDYLLKHPHLIPREWKNLRIYFFGTIYEYKNKLAVSYLGWFENHWSRHYNWFDDDCDNDTYALIYNG